jgi:RNA polymerase sigma factor (sigma-70 family)
VFLQLWRLGYVGEVEDGFQEVMVRLVRFDCLYDHSRGGWLTWVFLHVRQVCQASRRAADKGDWHQQLAGYHVRAGVVLGLFGADVFSPDFLACLDERDELILDAVRSLGWRDRAIVFHRFGFFGGEELTLGEIGALFGVSRERIRQLLERALGRLREVLVARGVCGD